MIDTRTTDTVETMALWMMPLDGLGMRCALTQAFYYLHADDGVQVQKVEDIPQDIEGAYDDGRDNIEDAFDEGRDDRERYDDDRY